MTTLYDYLPKNDADVITKLAEEADPHRKLKSIVKGVAGMGLGTLAGAGAAHYSDKLHQHFTGKPISSGALLTAAPILGAGLGLAYNLAQAHQQKEMTGASNQSPHNNG